MVPKKPEFFSKIFKFCPPPPWFELISHIFHHIFTLFFTHTQYLYLTQAKWMINSPWHFMVSCKKPWACYKRKGLRLPPLLRQHEDQSIIDDTSIVIVKWLISGCGTTTSMTIACTPVLLPPGVSYTENSFPKHYA
jgi:hypothetical protein